MTSVTTQLAQLTAADKEQLDSYIDVLKNSKNRAGNPLSAGTLVGYVNKLKQLYVDLKEDIFDPYEFEVWVQNKGYAPGTFIQLIDIVCKVAIVKCPEALEELEAMRLLYCGINNDKENDEMRWVYKDTLLAKFANISYHDLLRKVLNQAEAELAESNYPNAQDSRIRIILICLMLSANAPMRGDYRNIVIKNRMEVVPPKTPYYDNGWIHTPRGSRLKDSDGRKDSPEKIDMRGAQELIETCIATHDSVHLLGVKYDSSSFSRLLRSQTKRTAGVETGLGIRFFRSKYSVENDAVTEKAHAVLSIMGHTSTTHRKDYSGAARKEGASASCGGSAYGPTRPDYTYNAPKTTHISYGPTEYVDTFIEEVAAGFPHVVEGGLKGIEEDDVNPEDSAAARMAAEEEVMEAAKKYTGLVDYDSE